MQNYKFTISYDGTKYSGWQSQCNTENTIQGKLENVLTRMTASKVEVIGAGRTDAGVHALEMTANAHFVTQMNTAQILEYINNYLPCDICIKDVTIVSPRFHSRYNATGKTYRYTCYTGSTKPIFDRNFVYALGKCPDINKMRDATEYLLGTHDFKCFCGNAKFNKSSIRTIDLITIENKDDRVVFTYHGDGFLQNMVRIITGTLLEVGLGMRSPESIKQTIESKKRSEAGFTAPASGLCLIKVDYS